MILPGVLVFALGLAATVAPLTAAVLGSIEPGRSGLASGANNAVARIAGLLAIAGVGRVVSTSSRRGSTTTSHVIRSAGKPEPRSTRPARGRS